MREMTREALCQLVRAKACAVGGLSELCRRQGVHVSTLSNMLHGRNGCGIGQVGDPMFTLQAGKQHAVGVRRLTPTECERLQGFPDGWSCLCQPLEQYDANACRCPDGPRYKVMGNAVTVPVIEYLGRRLMEVA